MEQSPKYYPVFNKVFFTELTYVHIIRCTDLYAVFLQVPYLL